ncbi:MAG: nucleotidyl transferase AbiEii/AbiGii toxin family protein [Bacteriovoracaceae bacterium]|nr:nucleotidyl transferase AbiEii/AbiGii toxin family protein [Bacteriovoracaceae bacterium]
MIKGKYKETVDLLLEVLPYALKDERVALKGGTAINLFHRNFLRFSVDIDLCYLPLEDRKTTFKNLHEILRNLKEDLENKLGLRVSSNNLLDGNKEAKLVASRNGIEVKIEPNFVLRSSLFPAVELSLSKGAQFEFNKTVKARCLDVSDTYGGKICAALDRQHPRDLFDIKYLLENEGITEEVKDSFIFYLISHNRPINELLNPNLKDLSQAYENEFVDMAKVNVSLSELLRTRNILISSIVSSLNKNDQKFLMSFVSNNPDWKLVRNSKIKDFPSVRWKLFNQKKMSHKKLEKYIKDVKSVFFNTTTME